MILRKRNLGIKNLVFMYNIQLVQFDYLGKKKTQGLLRDHPMSTMLQRKRPLQIKASSNERSL